MADRTIPILPCRSIDEVLDFYQAIGFEVTYRQKSPNTFAIVRRGGIELQFFVLKAVDPANSYSTCYVITSDVDGLYRSFRDGIRAATGRVPLRGVPRIGALKDMSYGVRQFVMTDPGGNMIRIGQPLDQPTATTPQDRLDRALRTAVLLGDSKEDPLAAASTLDRALAADEPTESTTLFRALVFRADLALRLDDRPLATTTLTRAEAVPLTDADRTALTDDLGRVRDLRADLALT
ncbi:VOC family protein [Umezawaea sp. Da 62-37]|uniref:bleomycin resistance protein n=1 Tax=Umezawaea sp. Da 62-37 TaxID=3075927 RepID=UPI0028F6E914|nr:VOC family protein [Umezawaea sp. Da 62-37]WNV83407.1 VOC family protein [Umezawaea sp. Da 62-37]